MECKFFVGQKVVCVKQGTWRSRWTGRTPLVAPKQGEAVTIRELEVYAGSVWLVIQGYSGRWRHDFFRPATDIGIFREIVAKVKAGERDLVGAVR